MHVDAGGEGGLQRVHTTPETARRNYDSMAWAYDYFASYEAPHVAAGIAALKLLPGEVVLELGCGTGKAAEQLARAIQPGGHYFGLDVSEGMLDKASKRLHSAGLGEASTLIAADATAPLPRLYTGAPADDKDADENAGSGAAGCPLPPPPPAPLLADCAFLSFTLELFDTPMLPVVLASCRNALREGGRLVLVCMAKGKRTDKRGFALRVYEWAHESFPSTVDCRPIRARPLLLAAGFEVTSVEERWMYGLPVEVLSSTKKPTTTAEGGATTRHHPLASDQ